MEYGLVVVWLVTYFALGLAALPVAAVLFPRLADRGAGVAVPLALVLVALPAYWAGHLAFGWPALLVGLGVLLGASAFVRYRFDVALDWDAIVDTAAVFAVAFGFLVAVRAVDPAVHPIYGEKFLDFGLLKALLRAPVLPPEDMWFAGESVNYYYGGHFVASLLAILTDTGGSYAYNLALAGFYAMLVTAAFGVGGAIGRARGASRRGAGLAAAFFVGVASNLATPARAVAGLFSPSQLGIVSEEQADTFARGISEFSYWPASRAMDAQVVTEFPLFAWLNGDLHAHMMSTPFTLLVVALLVAYYRTPEENLARRRLLVFGCVPVVGGLLAFVNTWSFPTVGGLTALALLFAPADPTTLLPDPVGRRVRAFADGDPIAVDGGARAAASGGDEVVDGALARVERAARTEVVRGGVAAVAAAAVLLAGVGLGLPFFLGSASTREVALWEASSRSSLGGLLVVHGGFLVVFAAFLRSRVAPYVRGREVRFVLALAVVFAVGVGNGFAAFGLFVPFALVSWVLLRTASAGPSPDGEGATDGSDAGTATSGHASSRLAAGDIGFETLLVIAGAGLALVVEVAYVVEEAGPGRFNTVFKTYAQVWLLWGTAAGAMFGALVHEYVLAPAAAAVPDRDDEGGRANDGPSAVALVAAVLLVTSLSLYGGLALTNHFTENSIYPIYQTADDPTLNATAFVDEGHAEEAAAIRWLDAREGTPTIASAPGGYRWNPANGDGASAAASLTGLPTIVGWHHEIGYRGRAAYQQRSAEVRTIYTGSAEERACLLAKHDVEYVYVGPAEEATYGSAADGLSEVAGVGEPMRFDAVRIYPVDGARLPAGTTC